MENVLYVGFKGNYNSSSKLVGLLTGEKMYLTNSFKGLRKDIDDMEKSYDRILMFGLDKNLKEEIRFEKIAQRDGVQIQTIMEIDTYIELAKSNGIACKVSDKATAYLCNDAYYHMMSKMECPVLFVHIPTLKNMSDSFIDKLVRVFR